MSKRHGYVRPCCRCNRTDPACDNEREEFGERDAPPLKKAIEKTPTVPGELSFLYKNKESQRH